MRLLRCFWLLFILRAEGYLDISGTVSRTEDAVVAEQTKVMSLSHMDKTDTAPQPPPTRPIGKAVSCLDSRDSGLRCMFCNAIFAPIHVLTNLES